MESISLNIEAVNTHRERPEVSVPSPQSCPLVSPSFPLRSAGSEDARGGHREMAQLDARKRCWRTGASDGFLLCKDVAG